MNEPIVFIVEQISVDLVDTSTYGGDRSVVQGRTTVTLTSAHRDRIDIDWTNRGHPPDVGSRWTLAIEGDHQ